MPTLARLLNCKITMYPGDHLPPHFHVILSDGREALVVIADLAILSSRITKRELETALKWAQLNQSLLIAKWKELNP
jgi:Domain of unknown function (DUF4160)